MVCSKTESRRRDEEEDVPLILGVSAGHNSTYLRPSFICSGRDRQPSAKMLLLVLCLAGIVPFHCPSTLAAHPQMPTKNNANQGSSLTMQVSRTDPCFTLPMFPSPAPRANRAQQCQSLQMAASERGDGV